MSQKNLIVAFGGVSPEHEVSVLTAIQAISALEESEYNCIPLYVTKSGRWLTGEKLLDLSNYKELSKLQSESVSCAFVKYETGKTHLKEQEGGGLFSKPKSFPVYAVLCAFHGSEGENGSFQGVCEMMNVPYSGSGVLGSSLGMDKVKAKLVAAANGIPVTKAVNFYESDWEKEQEDIITVAEDFDYPLIVKPVSLGSSIGVAIANDKAELIDAVETAFRYDAHMLIEEAVNPLMEINCSVMGTPDDCRPSVCEKPLGHKETLSFEDKYQSGDGADKGMASADRVIPADISKELTKKIQNLATKTFSALDASGLARLDFLVNANTEEVYFNEINTIPGSFSFYLWEKSDISFRQLMEELIEIGVQQHRAKNGRVRSYETNLLSEKALKGIKGLKGSKN
ncbi:MAG: D-alanine--D-alanine ligase [Balneola sp.]|jgi:D-alanine-D-alanine ligase|nr:D-alanine--D-alanine ligase [Balneola sp.]MBE77977.1 D-alanine--D-alanine ligase [Balneola sp.]|tara:strand:+ start:18832 stop:20025 length:1194 start_codon:yes stop_codon:yes gene_type:complete